MAAPPELAVREMALSDVWMRIDYFHSASDEHLQMLGVDRSLLPSRAAWLEFYEADYSRPITERQNYSLVWEADGRPVGFSTTDRIVFGLEAFMHLHILAAHDRRTGYGAEFVRRSVGRYFQVLELQRLYCEPNAFNVGPNRTLQRAGFRYQFSHVATPSPINVEQVTTRWLLERPSR
jgi:RimJ/RimL family protein N-acetyltransferase